MSLYIGREGKIRFIDSTAPAFYVEMVLENMDFKGPLGRPRPEETLVLDRENLSSAMHYIVTSERAIAEPVAVSFTVRLDDTTLRQRMRDILDADSAAAWTVDGDTWVTTKGDHTLTDVDGNAHTGVAFADTRKRCCDVEVLWNSGATDIGVQYGAVYFDPGQQEIGEAEDAVSVTINGMCYEAITEITSLGGTNPS
jgi:hypothetical protein